VNYWIEANQIKARIDSLNPEFFDSLVDSMPVNLAYLLAREPRPTFDFDGKVVAGGVVDQNGKPVIGALVRLGGTNRGIVTDIDGKFALALTRGKGYLEISWQDATPIEVNLLSAEGDLENNSSFEEIVLEIPDGTTPVSRPSKNIRGRVKAPNGKGLPGVSVTARLQNIKTITDQSGDYSLTLNDDPTMVLLVFEIDGLRRERNYPLTAEPRQNLGEILLAEQQTPTEPQEPTPSEEVFRGRVVDTNDEPVIGATVILTGTTTRTQTDRLGEFTLEKESGANGLEISSDGYQTKILELFEIQRYLRSLFFADAVEKIVLIKNDDQQPATVEEQTIEGLLSKFQSGKYSKTVTREGTASEANDFINRLTRTLKNNSGRNKFLTGEELLSSLRSDYGQLVSIGEGRSHSSDGKFLFFGFPVRLPRLAQRIQQVRRESEALIITTSMFEDPAFVDYPDLSGSTANLTNELRGFGFNVRTVLNPTKAEMKAALAQVIKKNYDSSSQVLLIFNAHRIEGDIILKDSKYRDPATYLGQSELAAFHDWMFGLQHMLYIGNTVNATTIPQGDNEQNTTQNNQPDAISLTRSGVTNGKLGIGINYRPTLEVVVTAPGTMVFSICIDSYGRVANARFNQAKSDNFDNSQVQEVEKNAREWRFDVRPEGQAAQECGEVSFVFERQ
jgi:hypothetical protein